MKIYAILLALALAIMGTVGAVCQPLVDSLPAADSLADLGNFDPSTVQLGEHHLIDSLLADGELSFYDIVTLVQAAPSIASTVGLKYWAYLLLVIVTVFIPGSLRRLNLTKLPLVGRFLAWLDEMQNKYLAPLLALIVSVASLAFGGEGWGIGQVLGSLPEVFAGTFTLQQVAYWGMKLVEWLLGRLNIKFRLNGPPETA